MSNPLHGIPILKQRGEPMVSCEFTNHREVAPWANRGGSLPLLIIETKRRVRWVQDGGGEFKDFISLHCITGRSHCGCTARHRISVINLQKDWRMNWYYNSFFVPVMRSAVTHTTVVILSSQVDLTPYLLYTVAMTPWIIFGTRSMSSINT